MKANTVAVTTPNPDNTLKTFPWTDSGVMKTNFGIKSSITTLLPKLTFIGNSTPIPVSTMG